MESSFLGTYVSVQQPSRNTSNSRNNSNSRSNNSPLSRNITPAPELVVPDPETFIDTYNDNGGNNNSGNGMVDVYTKPKPSPVRDEEPEDVDTDNIPKPPMVAPPFVVAGRIKKEIADMGYPELTHFKGFGKRDMVRVVKSVRNKLKNAGNVDKRAQRYIDLLENGKWITPSVMRKIDEGVLITSTNTPTKVVEKSNSNNLFQQASVSKWLIGFMLLAGAGYGISQTEYFNKKTA